MEVCVTLRAKTHGEIRRFLNAYYERELDLQPGATQVTIMFSRPIEAHDMVSVFVDNCCDSGLELWVDLGGVNIRATEKNLYLVLCAILAKAA